MIIVIPSIRNINSDFLLPLLHGNNRIIVVDDTDEERIKSNSPHIEILHYSDRKKRLGILEECIPKKNGVCRDFGLLVAYQESDDEEIIVCLDDDCEVFEDYEKKAMQSLGIRRLPLLETSHEFYNPLDLYNLDMEIYPRGFPYEKRGIPVDYRYENKIEGNVIFNLGLWHGVFDVNAIDKLYLDKFSFDNIPLKYDQVAVQKHALVSLCSMNMIFRCELVPAIYQLPMNVPIIPEWTIDRYGDIWGGYICKKLIDIKGDLLSVGQPLIYHHKDSNLHRNIRQEHYAHLINVKFCELIEHACETIKPGSYFDMYGEFVDNIFHLENIYPEEMKAYLLQLREKMQLWVKALVK